MKQQKWKTSFIEKKCVLQYFIYFKCLLTIERLYPAKDKEILNERVLLTDFNNQGEW